MLISRHLLPEEETIWSIDLPLALFLKRRKSECIWQPAESQKQLLFALFSCILLPMYLKVHIPTLSWCRMCLVSWFIEGWKGIWNWSKISRKHVEEIDVLKGLIPRTTVRKKDRKQEEKVIVWLIKLLKILFWDICTIYVRRWKYNYYEYYLYDCIPCVTCIHGLEGRRIHYSMLKSSKFFGCSDDIACR